MTFDQDGNSWHTNDNGITAMACKKTRTAVLLSFSSSSDTNGCVSAIKHLTLSEAIWLRDLLTESIDALKPKCKPSEADPIETAWGTIETPVYRVDHGDLLSASSAIGGGQ